MACVFGAAALHTVYFNNAAAGKLTRDAVYKRRLTAAVLTYKQRKTAVNT